MDVFEAIDTLISIRRIKSDPIGSEKLDRILEAGVRAPSPANTQPWEFIVVRDKGVKERIAEINRVGATIYIQNRKLKMDEGRKRYLFMSLRSMPNIPVMVVLCINWEKADFMKKEGDDLNRKLEKLSVYGSIFPAMQNICVAARALGIGCWITMYHLYKEEEFRELLAIPGHIEPVAIISLGYPKGRFKESRRRDFRETTHYDRW
jgi:nitroreductase